MNPGSRNTLIIIGTLILGFAIGFLVNGWLTRIRIDNMRQDFAQRGMQRQIMRIIQPDAAQMKELQPIFDKYNTIRLENMESHFEQQRKIFNEFKSEIKPCLRKDQLMKLDSFQQNMRSEFPGMNRGNRGERHGRHQRNGNGRGMGNGMGRQMGQ